MNKKLFGLLLVSFYTIHAAENNEEEEDLKKSFQTAIIVALGAGQVKFGCTINRFFFNSENNQPYLCTIVDSIIPDSDSHSTEYFSSLGQFYAATVIGITVIDYSRRKFIKFLD